MARLSLIRQEYMRRHDGSQIAEGHRHSAGKTRRWHRHKKSRGGGSACGQNADLHRAPATPTTSVIRPGRIPSATPEKRQMEPGDFWGGAVCVRRGRQGRCLRRVWPAIEKHDDGFVGGPCPLGPHAPCNRGPCMLAALPLQTWCKPCTPGYMVATWSRSEKGLLLF